MTPVEQTLWFIRNLTLTDEFVGQPVKLFPWQEDFFRKLHRIDPKTQKRIVKRCLALWPRKSSKTQMATFEVLDHILNTEEGGRVALVAAGDRYQAGHLYKKVKDIIEYDPYLADQCRIYRSSKRIETKTGNVLQVMSSDGKRSHGENPSLVIADELWTWRSRDLLDALTSGFGARTEHLTLMISTAGNKREGPLWDQYEYARKVRDGLIDDPEYLPVIYEAKPDDDWKDEKTWHKAMPALSCFGNLEDIRKEFRLAHDIPSEESKVRQFYLNQWIAGEGKWLNRKAWDDCGKHPVDPKALEGRVCYGGADLSAKSDITAFVLVFPMEDGTYQVLTWSWIPKEYAKERDRKGLSTYQKWAENPENNFNLSSGFYINDDAIVDKIIELSKVYRIKNIKIDEWNAVRPATLLNQAGIDTKFFGQYHSTMNEPLKYLETCIATGKLHHGNHPVLNAHADSAAIDPDKHGNIKLDKKNSHDKIDMMVALTMAMAGAMVGRKKRSVYEDRGILTI